jgi:hypothetical protein
MHSCRRAEAGLRTWNMSYFLDDVARILASPMPRRQSLRLLGGLIAGTFLGNLGIRQAIAQQSSANAETRCGTGSLTCKSNQVCCTTGSKPFCVTMGKSCCGNTSCSSTAQTCCTTSSAPFCITKGKTCCGKTSCDPSHVCCNGVCCADHQVCVKGRCQASSA